MGRKPKFRPRITRVKLNPEQAVLLCNCYSGTAAKFVGSTAGTHSGISSYVLTNVHCKPYPSKTLWGLYHVSGAVTLNFAAVSSNASS
jgi:hypothetical protein